MIKCTLLINRIIVLSVVFHFIGFALKGPCELYFNGCCPNTQWDSERDMCVECPNGYFWTNCSRPCEYPYYGPKCGKNCSCERINCNHTSGCKNGMQTSTNPRITSEVSKATTVDVFASDLVSSKTRNISSNSIDAPNNPLHIALLIISIIVGMMIVVYLSVVAGEKYCI